MTRLTLGWVALYANRKRQEEPPGQRPHKVKLNAMTEARKKAKLVGIVDLVVLILNLVTLTWSAVLLAPPIPHFLEKDKDNYDFLWQFFWEVYESHDSHFSHLTLVYFWIMVTVQGVLTAIQIGTAIFLIKSTKQEVDPQKALKMALFWVTINFFIFLLYIAWRIKRKFWWMLGIGIAYRLILFYNILSFLHLTRKASSRVVNADWYSESEMSI